MNISNGEVVNYMEKCDYQATIDEQIEKLESIQRNKNLTASEACEVAKTIDFLLASRFKYEQKLR
jgi:hypothetical protein